MMTKRARFISQLLATLAFGLVLAACAGQPALPSGAYASVISRNDALSQDELSATARGIVAGYWEMRLLNGSHYMLITDGTILVEQGRYRLADGQLTLAAEGGFFACTHPARSGQAQATYQWIFEGEALTLTALADGCPTRHAVLTMHPLTRRG
jgi:hypothetical protein